MDTFIVWKLYFSKFNLEKDYGIKFLEMLENHGSMFNYWLYLFFPAGSHVDYKNVIYF